MVNIYNHVTDKSVLNQRHPRDLYVTPPALIRHFFKHAFSTYEMLVSKGKDKVFNVLDLGAGDARWGEGVRRYMHNEHRRWQHVLGEIHVTAVDLEVPDKHYADTYYALDYFLPEIGILEESYDVVVANPPFRDSLARHGSARVDDGLTFRDGIERTLRIGMQFVRPGGAVILFHPATFLWSMGRYERMFSQWTYFLPFRTYIIPFRVPLVEGVTTGLPTEFAVSIWQKENWWEEMELEPPSLTVEFLPPLNVQNVWEWKDA